MNDMQSMNEIEKIMSGNEWSADTLEDIAEVVRESGREIKDSNEVEA